MTERERLLAVLSGEVPDRTPWYGDLSWWHSAHLRRGDLPDRFARGPEGYLAMHAEAGVGIYLYPPFLWTDTPDTTVEVHTESGGGQTVTTIETPVGTVRSVLKDLPDSGTSAYVEHFVKRAEDLKVFRYVWEHRQIRPNYEAFAECDRLWGPHGLACALAPVCTSPLQTLMTRWAGADTTFALVADCPEELEATLRAVEAADDPVFEIICASGAVFVEFPENLSGELTGRNLMRRYEVPYWRRRIEQLHASGKKVGIHNDGTLRQSLPLLIEAGFDVVEAATPAPAGDMSLTELREATAGKIIVWGGLPGALFSSHYSDADFDDFVRQVLRTFPRDSGFVLGVADQVPPDATFNRICRVRELVDQWG